MRLKHSVKTAFIGLGTNRTRSALTILGIVIGIAAIMLMMSLGKGAEDLILGELGGLGAETVVIRPGREPEGPTDIGGTIFADSLKARDITLLQRHDKVPELVDLMPVLLVPGSVSFEGETYAPQILGGKAEFFAETFDIKLADGVFFGENEIRARASVAVIGSKVKDELFGNQPAVGKNIQIKDRKFRVIGVLESKGQAAFLNFDETVMIPYTAAQSYLLGIDYYHEIIVKTTGPDAVPRAVFNIEATMREAHGITDKSKDDFFVVTQQGVVEQVGTILRALTAFLSSVVAIALVVGGIGIMNIMLVSVTERTREIGLRKALGATGKDILVQFLLEAVILTGIGGIVGILLGGVLSFLVTFALGALLNLDWSFSFPFTAVLLGLSVSTVVGLLFGIYPARQAAKKSPIEALRYE